MPEGVDGFELKFTDPTRRRRHRFERQSPGGWVHIEYEFRDGRWRRVGQQLVTEVSVEVDQAVLDDAVDVIWPDGPSATEVRGP